MITLLNTNNFKTYLIVVIAVIAVWFFKDYSYQKRENKRQSENISSIRMMDSLRFASQNYTKKELEEYLEYSRNDLKAFLIKNKINQHRIEQIITQKLEYLDKQSRSTDLQPILDAIKHNRNIALPVKDSTKCLVIEGWVRFENDSL